MNTYEFTFLLEDSKDLKTVEKALESQEGKKLNEEAWGKRLLTFPVNKITSAEYYTWYIQIAPSKLEAFKKKLNYDKLVMRYIVLNQEHTTDTSSSKKKKS